MTLINLTTLFRRILITTRGAKGRRFAQNVRLGGVHFKIPLPVIGLETDQAVRGAEILGPW